jgi:hypothetical protein
MRTISSLFDDKIKELGITASIVMLLRGAKTEMMELYHFHKENLQMEKAFQMMAKVDFLNKEINFLDEMYSRQNREYHELAKASRGEVAL